MTSYSLKASCTNCKQYGRIDDTTLICGKCGVKHELTAPEAQQLRRDLAAWGAYESLRHS